MRTRSYGISQKRKNMRSARLLSIRKTPLLRERSWLKSWQAQGNREGAKLELEGVLREYPKSPSAFCG